MKIHEVLYLSKCIKQIFFRMKEKKMCAYPTQDFETRYPKHIFLALFRYNLITMQFFFQEFEIIDYFLGPKLKDEVLKIMPVQKQTRAGQRTRFKVSSL